jgi:hypothetical protein
MAIVYLLHISPPFKHACHYAGVTKRDDLWERLEEHRTGRGALMLRHASNAGSNLMLARVWYDVPRKFELSIKGRSMRYLCPICVSPEVAFRNRARS